MGVSFQRKMLLLFVQRNLARLSEEQGMSASRSASMSETIKWGVLFERMQRASIEFSTKILRTAKDRKNTEPPLSNRQGFCGS